MLTIDLSISLERRENFLRVPPHNYQYELLNQETFPLGHHDIEWCDRGSVLKRIEPDSGAPLRCDERCSALNLILLSVFNSSLSRELRSQSRTYTMIVDSQSHR